MSTEIFWILQIFGKLWWAVILKTEYTDELHMNSADKKPERTRMMTGGFLDGATSSML